MLKVTWVVSTVRVVFPDCMFLEIELPDDCSPETIIGRFWDALSSDSSCKFRCSLTSFKLCKKFCKVIRQCEILEKMHLISDIYVYIILIHLHWHDQYRSDFQRTCNMAFAPNTHKHYFELHRKCFHQLAHDIDSSEKNRGYTMWYTRWKFV